MKAERCVTTRPCVRKRARRWAWPRTAVGVGAATLACWLSAQSASRGDLFTFDTEEDFEDSFSQKAPGQRLGWTGGPGVSGDSGRVDVRSVPGGPLVFHRPFAWDAWDSISAHVYFYYDVENTPSRGGGLAAVGLLSWETGNLGSASGSPYVGVSVASLPSHLQSAHLMLQTTLLSGWQYSLPFDLSTSGWYRLGGTWSLGEGAAIECAARLFWHGTDGSEPGREIASYWGTVLNPYVASDSSVFVAVKAGPPAAPYLDNIWIIPEPSASALAILGTLAVCGRLRGLRRTRPGPLYIAREER